MPTKYNKENQRIKEQTCESKIIILDKYRKLADAYLLLCSDQMIIIISEQDISLIQFFFENNKEATLISLSKEIDNYTFYEDILQTSNSFNFKFINNEDNFFLSAKKLSTSFQINQNLKELSEIMNKAQLLISAFIIQKALNKSNENRIENYNKSINKKVTENLIEKDEYIEIQYSGNGNNTQLIYLFEQEQIFAKKCFRTNEGDVESRTRFFVREHSNYLKLKHPFLPKYIGYSKDEKESYLIIENIKGTPLNKITQMNLSNNDKMKIIFEIMISIEYLHDSGFVYLDLNPDNIIVDDNKNIVLIDLHQMVPKDYQEKTVFDHSSLYIPPEISTGFLTKYSQEIDIYSLGILIYFIFFEKHPCRNQLEDLSLFEEFPNEFSSLKEICQNCTNNEPSKRSNIAFVIDYFYTKIMIEIPFQIINLSIDKIVIDEFFPYWMFVDEFNNIGFQKKIGLIYKDDVHCSDKKKKKIHYYFISSIHNHAISQYKLALLYSKGKYIDGNSEKMIHYLTLSSNQNYIKSQHYLGIVYIEGKLIDRDINKAILYFTLSAEQNCSESQNYLGLIYYNGEYVEKDISKAIHYFKLSSQQNHPESLYYLGLIYYHGEFVEKDKNKAIHYIKLSADNNFAKSQFLIGFLHYNGLYVERDINKSIHYLTLSANQNYVESQYKLGLIYYEGKYIERDINKSIHYLTLSANQNYVESQYKLGLIYYEGKYIERDIHKSIHYFSVAADQDDLSSQFLLGLIYYSGQFIEQDINKSIHYLTLSANKNHMMSQCLLGHIYFTEEKYSQDINKAIHYLTLSANQNEPNSQYYLGLIYFCNKMITQDLKKSLLYFSLSANQNHPNSQYFLGYIYLNGKGVEKDINKRFIILHNQQIKITQIHNII